MRYSPRVGTKGTIMVKAPDGNFVTTVEYEALLRLTKTFIGLTDEMNNSEVRLTMELITWIKQFGLCRKMLLNIINKDNRR